jgi:putative tryptophan/tyrosine transport system substrate-binding protein
MPVIGFLNTQSPEGIPHWVAAFRQGLKETGFVEGQNVAIEYRWAQSQYDRLPELAADLVRRRVAVIVTPGSTPRGSRPRRRRRQFPLSSSLVPTR